jgi:hypothetical protein
MVLASLLAGCASGKQNCPPAEPPTAASTESFDAPQALRDASRWLPTDTSVVAVVDPEFGWKVFAEFLPHEDGDAAEDDADTSGGESGTLSEPRGVDAIRADMQRLSVARLGFDITAAEGIVLGGSPTWEAIFVQGQFTRPRAEASQISGRTVYRLEGLTQSEYNPLQTIWVVPTSEPAGLAIFVRAASMRSALSALEVGGQTLADGPALGRLTELLGQYPGSRVYGAALADVEPLSTMVEAKISFEAPREVAFGIGDSAWVGARGSKTSLDAIESRYAQMRERFDELRDRRDRVIAEENLEEAMAVVAVFGTARSYFDNIESKRGQGQLTYRMPLPRTTSLSLVAAGALSWVMPRLLRNPSVRHIREAEERMRKMSSAAKAYFTSEQKYWSANQSAREPWHVAGSSDSTTAAGYPVPFGEYVFPGGTDQKLVSHDEVPAGGEPAEPNPSAREHLEATMRLLHADFQDPTPFRFTYETNDASGPGAEAVLRAEADFDPSTPERHTMEVRLEIDPTTQEVIVMPMITENEYE